MNFRSTKLITFLFFLFLLPLLFAFVLSIPGFYDQTIPPHTFASTLNLGLMTPEEAKETLQPLVDKFLASPFDLFFNNKKYSFIPKKMGISVDLDKTLREIPLLDRNNFLQSLRNNLPDNKILLNPDINYEKLETALKQKIIPLRRGTNAKFVFYATEGLKITPEQKILKIDFDHLTTGITDNLNQFKSDPLYLRAELTKPPITEKLIASQKEIIQKRLSAPIKIKEGREAWTLNLKDFSPSFPVELKLNESFPLINLAKQAGLINLPLKFTGKDELLMLDEVNPALSIEVQININQDELLKYIREKVTPKINIASQGIKIYRDADQKIIFEGVSQDGKELEEEKLVKIISAAINQDIPTVNIPLKLEPAKVETSEEFQKLGINELIAVGYSSFAGSSSKRIHNIKIGMQRYQGLLIAPNEEFSFNKYLGPVDGSAGYLKELVIKQKKVEPDFGGGLCQVSSTVYRAAFFGGFPLTQKKPHSFAVSYYAFPLGYGLDATIYPPTEDLKFINDTGQHFLIESYVDGLNAYIKFYGTSDGRIIETDGPYISNKKSAPSEPVIEYTDQLAPGEKQQKEKAVGGFDATWYRTIIKNNQEIKETWLSRYQAWPARFVVGSDPKDVAKPEEKKEG